MQLLLIYDGWCGVCTRAARWIHRHDPARRVLLVPSQAPGVRQKAGLSKHDVDHAVWAIDTHDRRYKGAAAINRTLEELGGWRYLAVPYRVSLIRQIEDRMYRWFADNRGRFGRWGITPACEHPGVGCPPEGT